MFPRNRQSQKRVVESQKQERRVGKVRNARIVMVRHRSRATSSRQPRQVRKEATVTGSCVCSGPPVSGFFDFAARSGEVIDWTALLSSACSPSHRCSSRMPSKTAAAGLSLLSPVPACSDRFTAFCKEHGRLEPSKRFGRSLLCAVGIWPGKPAASLQVTPTVRHPALNPAKYRVRRHSSA